MLGMLTSGFRALGMKALQHADEDDGMPHRLPI
jgi:hypothetical protein